MRATTIHGPFDVRVEEVPDPAVQEPTDAVVRTLVACVCGSDLWRYRGDVPAAPGSRIGHELVGVVEDVGADVASVRPGDLVVAPFVISDGTCEFCRAGLQTSCLHGRGWGSDGVDGCQGEAVRVPLADGTLVPVPGGAGLEADDARLRALLTLSDVMGTGHHAALAAGVGPGSTAAVVGDGAVGLCAVLACARLGAERVVVLGRHARRTDLARRFGATDVVPQRGEEAAAAVRELTGGLGAASVLECVGTSASWATAMDAVRPGGRIGYVGVPAGVGEGIPLRPLFAKNATVAGGIAPVRAYLPELLDDVLDGPLTGDRDPGQVLDAAFGLDDVAGAYAAMHERTAIKALLRP